MRNRYWPAIAGRDFDQAWTYLPLDEEDGLGQNPSFGNSISEDWTIRILVQILANSKSDKNKFNGLD